MDTQNIDSQKMEALKALSNLNLQLSEARELLFKLEEEETTYLIAREKKAMERIQKVVDDSRSMLNEADQNYEQIKTLAVEIAQFIEGLSQIKGDFQKLIAEFEQRNEEWERQIGKQQDDIFETRKALKIQATALANERKNIEQARNKLADEQRKLEVDRGALKRAIDRLKNNRI